MKTRFGVSVVSLAVAVATATTSCNVFSPFDSPNGNDKQLLEYARACFDQGDLDCAREYYEKLDGTPYEDNAKAELAFAILEEAGAGMGNFITAFAGGGESGGEKLTRLANVLIGKASEANRLKIFDAYTKARSMSGANAEYKALVQFLVATSLAANLLAEAADSAGSSGVFEKADYASGPSACVTAGTPACAVNANCSLGSTQLVPGTGGTFSLDTATTANLTGTNPTLYMLHASLQALSLALGAMRAGGKFGDVSSLASQLTDPTVSAEIGMNGGKCYYFYLLDQNIGM